MSEHKKDTCFCLSKLLAIFWFMAFPKVDQDESGLLDQEEFKRFYCHFMADGHRPPVEKRFVAQIVRTSERITDIFYALTRPVGNVVSVGIKCITNATFKSVKAAIVSMVWGPPVVFRPESIGIFYWNMLITLSVLYSGVIVTYRISFESQPEGVMLALEYILEIAFLLDIWVSMRTGFYDDEAEYEQDIVIIRWKYWSSKWFIIDLVSSFPVLLLSFALPDGVNDLAIIKVLRAIKIFRLLKLMNISTLKELEQRSPIFTRLCKLIFVFAFTLHIFACTYYAIIDAQCGGNQANLDHHAQYEFCPIDAAVLKGNNDLLAYLFSFYFAVNVMVGNVAMQVGTVEQYFFGSLVLLIGIACFSSILGSASALLASLDSKGMERENQMNTVRHYLSYRNLAPTIKKDILGYFAYMWESGRSSYQQSLLDQLPESMKFRLKVALKERLIIAVPMFRKCVDQTLLDLINCLSPKVGVPEEYIISQGAEGDEMYFIAEGRVKITVFTGHMTKDEFGRELEEEICIQKLMAGGHFGEMALLGQRKRSANVVSDGFTELEVLSYRDLSRMLRMHPELQAQLEGTASNRVAMMMKYHIGIYRSTKLPNSKVARRTSQNLSQAHAKVDNEKIKLTHHTSGMDRWLADIHHLERDHRKRSRYRVDIEGAESREKVLQVFQAARLAELGGHRRDLVRARTSLDRA